MHLDITEDSVFIHFFHIKPPYRGRKYSYRIFKNLKKTYNKPIYLQCFITLLRYYKKLNFKSTLEIDNQGYYTMVYD